MWLRICICMVPVLSLGPRLSPGGGRVRALVPGSLREGEGLEPGATY